MVELFLTFVGGALGSSHCLGMCGGFALALGANAVAWRVNLARQLLYSLGRISTYSFAGAVAGYGGLRLINGLPTSINAQATLALGAGLLLLYEGLRAAGAFSRCRSLSTHTCLGPGFFGPLLTGHSWSGTFLAGVFTGFLPCGLVFAFLSLAATSGNMLTSAARMAAFGAGTAPLMVLAGLGGTALSLAARRSVLRLAGCCVTVSGAISVARGITFLFAANGASHVGCPLCH